jgi:hypothetical protein
MGRVGVDDCAGSSRRKIACATNASIADENLRAGICAANIASHAQNSCANIEKAINTETANAFLEMMVKRTLAMSRIVNSIKNLSINRIGNSIKNLVMFPLWIIGVVLSVIGDAIGDIGTAILRYVREN